MESKSKLKWLVDLGGLAPCQMLERQHRQSKNTFFFTDNEMENIIQDLGLVHHNQIA